MTAAKTQSAPVLDSWALVQRVQAGDTEAFGDLYRYYYDTVFRYIQSRTGNRHLTEDLTADTFTRALKNIHGFTWQDRDFAAWLVTIARNRVFDHFKSGTYRLEILGDVHAGSAGRVDPSPEARPEESALDAVTHIALAAAVARLLPRHRAVITMRFFEGLRSSEIAAKLGCDLTAVKARQYRAVGALARLLPAGVDERGAPPEHVQQRSWKKARP